MSEYVKKDDILLSLCEYCDSHIVGCGECPIKAAINRVQSFDSVYGYSIENLIDMARILSANKYTPKMLDRFLIEYRSGVKLGYKNIIDESNRSLERFMNEINGGGDDVD